MKINKKIKSIIEDADTIIEDIDAFIKKEFENIPKDLHDEYNRLKKGIIKNKEELLKLFHKKSRKKIFEKFIEQIPKEIYDPFSKLYMNPIKWKEKLEKLIDEHLKKIKTNE